MDQEFWKQLSRIVKVSLEIKVRRSVTSEKGQSHAQQVDAAWWPETSIPYHVNLFGHPSVLIPWWLVSPRASDPREIKVEATMFFCDLVSEVIVHHFCNILWVARVRTILRGRGLHRAWMPGSETHWVHLGSGASNVSQAFRWCISHLHCNLMRRGAPELSI